MQFWSHFFWHLLELKGGVEQRLTKDRPWIYEVIKSKGSRRVILGLSNLAGQSQVCPLLAECVGVSY